jgi:hypothetical protein
VARSGRKAGFGNVANAIEQKGYGAGGGQTGGNPLLLALAPQLLSSVMGMLGGAKKKRKVARKPRSIIGGGQSLSDWANNRTGAKIAHFFGGGQSGGGKRAVSFA